MEKIIIFNPATQEKVAEVPIFSQEMVTETVKKAKEAQKSWGCLELKERIKYLKSFQKYIRENHEEFIRVIQSETGKVWHEAMIEILYIAMAIDHWTKNAEGYLSEKIKPHWLLMNKECESIYHPKPVVVIIGPWNLPLDLNFGEAIPALVAGCCVILKPSSQTPLTSLYAAEVCQKLGFPEGVVQVVTGPGSGKATQELIKLADKVAFTGSVKTGQMVTKTCLEACRETEKFTFPSLELGGKTPFIILKDANLERASNCAVWNAFANCGHYCKSAERVYVMNEIYDEFVDRVVKKTKNLRLGIDYGPVITAFQLEKIREQVADAIAKGAKVLCGGEKASRPKGRWFDPMVLVNVNHAMKIMKEETFGPLLPIVKVFSPKEALTLANDSPLGLNGVIFSKNTREAKKIAKDLQVGVVTINDAMTNYMIIGAPQGGVKLSGFGRRHGREGIQKYCEQKTIETHKWNWPGFKNREFWWFPFTNFTKKIFKLMLRAFR